MDAVEFLKYLKKMCDKYSIYDGCDYDCNSNCPLYEIEHDGSTSENIKLFNFMRNNPQELVEIVEKWSKEHPIKTRLQDFLEKYPNAPKMLDGLPRVCTATLGYRDFCEVGFENVKCKKCWSEPTE